MQAMPSDQPVKSPMPAYLLCRRQLRLVALLAGVTMLAGLAGADLNLAGWLAGHGLLDAPFFTTGMRLIDTVTGVRAGAIWAAGLATLALGLIGLAARRGMQHARLLVAAGLVNVSAMASMVSLKLLFGRMRPFEVGAALQQANPLDALWFVGGTSFPSGHAAFYFGLFLPLAAGTRSLPARVALLAVPLYVAAARINLDHHYLSDVAASALLVSLLCMAVNRLMAAGQPRTVPAH